MNTEITDHDPADDIKEILADVWKTCNAERLSGMLRDHVIKGDPVDVGNFAMMLHQNGQAIAHTQSFGNSGELDDREAFEAWAKREGYDVAHTYDTERSRHVWLNPMTADLWAAWQAALAQRPSAQDRGDAERMDWICDHATVQGGGDGMTVTFRAPDSEDIRAAIDDARAAKGQPCAHVFEARQIDGSRSASAPVEAVCRKCGYRPGAAKGE